MNFEKGDILKGSLGNYNRDKAFHPIIYLGEIDENQISLSKNDFFMGGMITHNSENENVLLEDIHFEQKIDRDPRPSYFVNNFLIKRKEWKPFVKVGKLSDIGISFVESKISGTNPQIWEDYTK